MSFSLSLQGHKNFDSDEDSATFEGQVLDAVKKFVRELDSDTGGAVTVATFYGNQVPQVDVLAQTREDAGLPADETEQAPDQDNGERDTPGPLTGDGAIRDDNETDPASEQTVEDGDASGL